MRKSASFFAGLVFALAVAGCNGYNKVLVTSTLNAANEVPVPAGETGSGTLNLEFDGPVANWTLTITSVTSGTITASHIHTGAPGVSGAVMVFLYDGPGTGTPVSSGTFKGSFIDDQVQACGATCLAGRSFDGVQAAVEGKTAYVNVHTTGNPGGAIRGNF